MKKDYVEKYEYKGYTIKVCQDEDAQAPNEFDNTDTFLVYDHRDFTVKVDGYDPGEIFEQCQERKKFFYDGYFVFPVYAYIHSGVSLSLGRNTYPFTCNWDTSFKGFCLVKRSKGWTWTKEKAYKVAESIVEEWNNYLSGNVYGYVIEDTDGENLESCWGFYGDEYKEDGYMVTECKSIIDHIVKDARKKHFNQVKTWIKNKVPFLYRQPLEQNLSC